MIWVWKMKVWLDDRRYPPKGWCWAKSVDEAKMFFEYGEIEYMSLDYDMGYGEASGYELCTWMRINSKWPTKGVTTHSSSQFSNLKMQKVLGEHYIKMPEN